MDRVVEAELHVGEPEESPREVPGDEAREKDGPGDASKREPDGGPRKIVRGHKDLEAAPWTPVPWPHDAGRATK